MLFYPQANGFIMIDGDDVSSGRPPSPWDPRQYERVVQNVLGRIQASRTGGVVLETIRDLARRPNQPGGIDFPINIQTIFHKESAYHIAA